MTTTLPEPCAGWAFIYALCDPDTMQPRYIGVSAHPSRRFAGHKSAADNNCRKNVWVRQLWTRGRRPVVSILEKVPAEEALTAETAVIEQYRAAGFDLLNTTRKGRTGALRPCPRRRRHKVPKLLRLTPEAAELLDRLSERVGMSANVYVETLVRAEAEKRGVKAEEKDDGA